MELLIHNTGRGTPGNADWNRGDIVWAASDDWNWGLQEDPRTRTDEPLDLFIILRLPGKALGVQLRANLHATMEDPDGNMLARCYWWFDIDNALQGVKDQLAEDGVATIGWGALKDALVYRPTGGSGNDNDPEDPI
jgi:hypothetical protein